MAGAGARGVRVTAPGGRVLDAVPVLFDPDLDVALLHVVRLAAPPLAFAPKDPGRGAIGATLGYPGGGALTIVPAAVSGHFAATGLDIYGDSKVRRQILELRAEIDRGDSGGPFILADGTVGGVVFAEAKTNEDVGYALSARRGRDTHRARARSDRRGRHRRVRAHLATGTAADLVQPDHLPPV